MRWPGWHMVAQSSHYGHVTMGSAPIPKAVGVHSNHGSSHTLGCDRKVPMGYSHVWSGPIGIASGVLGGGDGVNPVGHGARPLSTIELWEQIVTLTSYQPHPMSWLLE